MTAGAATVSPMKYMFSRMPHQKSPWTNFIPNNPLPKQSHRGMRIPRRCSKPIIIDDVANRTEPPTDNARRPHPGLDAPIGYQRRRGVRQPLAPDAGSPAPWTSLKPRHLTAGKLPNLASSALRPLPRPPTHLPQCARELASEPEPCPASSPDAPSPASGPAPRSLSSRAPPAQRRQSPFSAGRTP